MNKQTQFVIGAWKHIAELDDIFAEQATEAARRITERFELKKNLDAFTAANNFRLEFSVRKESIAGENKASHAWVLLELSLVAVTTTASREAYAETVKLLQEATQEAMALPPVLTRMVVRFRWAGEYRCPMYFTE